MNALAEFDLDASLSQCRALHDAGRYAEARSIASVSVQSTVADPVLHWKSLTTLGNVLRADERFEPALDAHVYALQIALSLKDAVRTAMSWNNLGKRRSKEHWAILPACRRQAGLYSDAQRILTEPAVKLLSHPFGNDPFRFF